MGKVCIWLGPAVVCLQIYCWAVFQDDVKYNQITTAVGQYLANSDVIPNAIKNHLVNQDKTTQEQKEVPKEVKTLLRNMVRTEANKQW